MKLKIIGYDTSLNCHICEMPDGEEERIDILVSADIPVPDADRETEESWVAFCRSLIGREVVCRSVTPFQSIAHDVRLL